MCRFSPNCVTSDIAVSQTGDASMRAARTPTHWLVSSPDSVFTCNATEGEYTRVRDAERADAIRSFFDAEFAPDAEKARIAMAVENAQLT